MNEGAVGLIFAIGICYVILTVFMPAMFLYKYIKHKRFVVRFAVYQVTGNAWLIAMGFVLSLLNIWSEALVVILTIAVPIAVKIFVFRRDLFVKLIEYQEDKRAKLVTTAATLRSIKEKILKKLKELYYRYIRYHYIEIIFFIALAAFAFWYYGFFKLYNFTYASSDEATHLYWVNALFANNSFPVGMYPHSMHFVMAGIHSISGMQTLIINHYFSVIITLMIHFMIFLAVKELFNSTAAAIGATGLYLFADMFIAQRYHNTLPMEFGFIAMLAMIILLTEFMKRGDKFNMWMAAIATGWTFHAHFYVTIFSAFIWLAFIIVYLKTMIRLRSLLRMLLIILLSIAIAIVPFAIGFAAGHPFEQSIGWALGVMGVDDENDKALDLILNGVNRETAAEESSEEETGEDSEEETEETSETAAVKEEPVKELTAHQIEFKEAKTPEQLITAAAHLLTERVVKDEKSALLIYALILFAIIYGIGEIIWSNIAFRKKYPQVPADREGKRERKRKKQEFIVRNGLILVVPFIVVFGIGCTILSYLGFPEIIDDSRSAMILSPLLALLFAVPIKLAEDMLKLIPVRNKRAIETTMLLIVGGGLGVFYVKGPLKQLDTIGCYAVTQQLSNELSYDLIGTHTRNTWTVISPVNDLLAIHYYGYHYEIIDLLMEIEDGDSPIYMPTNDLYVVVEKKTMNAIGVYYLPYYHQQLAEQSFEISEELVDLNYYDLGLPWMSPEEAYTTFRNVTMSKLYYWMEEFKKAYPNEVEVYSEDDLCVVYHIRQSADFPLNLAVDYRKKNFGVRSREDFERRYAEKYGLEYEEREY